MARLAGGLAQRTFAVPWLAQAPVGLAGLVGLLDAGAQTGEASPPDLPVTRVTPGGPV